MPRRWFRNGLEIAALMGLGQAAMLAQREPEPLAAPASVTLPLAAPEQDFGRLGTRIYETPLTVVVAVKLPPTATRRLDVAVVGGAIRFAGPSSPLAAPPDDIPIPSGADPSRYEVRRVGDELRVVFARVAEEAAAL